MWWRWAVAAAAIVGFLILLSMFVFGDRECRTWQKGYTVVYEEFVLRNGPLVENEVVEETDSRMGSRPAGCDIPEPIDE